MTAVGRSALLQPVAVLVAYLEFTIDTDQHRRLRPDVEIVIRPPVGAAYRYMSELRGPR